MKCQLSNTIYGLKFAMEKNDFERLKSSNGKKRNYFFANPILFFDSFGKLADPFQAFLHFAINY